MKIVVLCGGLSMERNVSITSGTLICKALRESGHRAILVDMYYGLEDVDIPLDRLFDELPEIVDARVDRAAPDLEQVKAARKWKSPSMVGKGVFELCALADVVFLGLHGTCGEDGRIQAALELMGIPYTGSGYLGSAIAMDKDLTKQLAAAAGVRTPRWKLVYYDKGDTLKQAASIGLPCVVKPVDSGSSIGVAIAHDQKELSDALELNRPLGRAIVEQYIQGREIDVGVLKGEGLPSIEIRPKHGFYDYVNKYQAGATVEICPSPIEPAIEAELRRVAVKVHELLGLKTYSRSDYIVDAEGDVYFLEMNTLPGMTPTSLMPQEAAAIGIDYKTLCQIIVDDAVKGGRDA
ncbi:MAG: D-alanine--D-alanine ligase [Clostridia bacterium]|nr:D-alanine--D-alanine ligase [Clostridia bacterium]